MSKKNPTPEEIAAVFGFDVEEVKAKLPDHGKTAAEKRSLQAEATRSRLYDPEGWWDKKCKFCNKMFSTNYKYVSLCSDTCRRKDFEEIGLIWDSSRSVESRWIAMRITPPAIVPPEALAALVRLGREYAKMLDMQEGKTGVTILQT